MPNRFYLPPIFPTLPDPPASPVQGECYFDTTLNELRVYSGTEWKLASGALPNSKNPNKAEYQTSFKFDPLSLLPMELDVPDTIEQDDDLSTMTLDVPETLEQAADIADATLDPVIGEGFDIGWSPAYPSFSRNFASLWDMHWGTGNPNGKKRAWWCQQANPTSMPTSQFSQASNGYTVRSKGETTAVSNDRFHGFICWNMAGQNMRAGSRSRLGFPWWTTDEADWWLLVRHLGADGLTVGLNFDIYAVTQANFPATISDHAWNNLGSGTGDNGGTMDEIAGSRYNFDMNVTRPLTNPTAWQSLSAPNTSWCNAEFSPLQAAITNGGWLVFEFQGSNDLAQTTTVFEHEVPYCFLDFFIGDTT